MVSRSVFMVLLLFAIVVVVVVDSGIKHTKHWLKTKTACYYYSSLLARSLLSLSAELSTCLYTTLTEWELQHRQEPALKLNAEVTQWWAKVFWHLMLCDELHGGKRLAVWFSAASHQHSAASGTCTVQLNSEVSDMGRWCPVCNSSRRQEPQEFSFFFYCILLPMNHKLLSNNFICVPFDCYWITE